MTPEQQYHLERVRNRFDRDLSIKYETGQDEHGGDVWTKPAMMHHLRDEIVDLVVYQDVLQEQLEAAICDLLEAVRTQDWAIVSAVQGRLDAMLFGAQD